MIKRSKDEQEALEKRVLKAYFDNSDIDCMDLYQRFRHTLSKTAYKAIFHRHNIDVKKRRSALSIFPLIKSLRGTEAGWH